MITKSDYTKFLYNSTHEDGIWTAIKDRISNNAVIFIGYDLEDENVRLILQKIFEILGPNRKEQFLLAPGFKQHKISYLNQLGIQYIDMKGEVFVKKFTRTLNSKSQPILSNGYVSSDTLRKFFLKKIF